MAGPKKHFSDMAETKQAPTLGLATAPSLEAAGGDSCQPAALW